MFISSSLDNQNPQMKIEENLCMQKQTTFTPCCLLECCTPGTTNLKYNTVVRLKENLLYENTDHC